MKWFYIILMMVISFVISSIVYLGGEKLQQEVYWTNTLLLVSIIGIASYYRYKEYEKNKNA